VLCGFQSGRALAELFSNCAVFVLPSSHEGLPIALLEAMSYGCRIVASDIEANRNLALDTPCYFATGNIDALDRAVEHALTLPFPADWRDRLAPFDWKRIAVETVKVYEDALR
jgi:glycosyltransferase involved in cell wall biosynthesis